MKHIHQNKKGGTQRSTRHAILRHIIESAIRDHQGSSFVDTDLTNRLAAEIDNVIPLAAKLNYRHPPTADEIIAALEVPPPVQYPSSAAKKWLIGYFGIILGWCAVIALMLLISGQL